MALLLGQACLLGAGGAYAAPGDETLRNSASGPVRVALVAEGLDQPWALGFLPGGGFLVTEKAGRLWFYPPQGPRVAVRGLPEVRDSGQGGLLDVMVPRDFASSRQIYLSYAMPQGRGAGTALAVGRLAADGRTLEDLRQIFAMAPGSTGGRHFGSRIVEGRDGTLFLTVGERGDRPAAQDLSRSHGTILRLNRDGTVPADNPFVGTTGALGEIWSYGHRNPQGAALDDAGQLWAVEHGAQGGDEVNRIGKGRNYGWPVISYGRHYSGGKIGEGQAKPGMEQPAQYWDPSIAPSGMTIYSGDMFPEWRGDMLIGSLKFDMISRLERDGDGVTEAERLDWPETGRVRDVRQAPDGSIWFISEGNDAIYRISKDP